MKTVVNAKDKRIDCDGKENDQGGQQIKVDEFLAIDEQRRPPTKKLFCYKVLI